MERKFIYRFAVIFLLLFNFLPVNAQYFNFQKPVIDDEVFLVVEMQPHFPYGLDSLARFIRKNIQFPYESRKNRISGKVFFDFIIDKNGHLINLKLIKGINEELDREATRIMYHIPFWFPGEHNGHKMNVHYQLPIKFHLPECEYYFANPFLYSFPKIKQNVRNRIISKPDIECF